MDRGDHFPHPGGPANHRDGPRAAVQRARNAAAEPPRRSPARACSKVNSTLIGPGRVRFEEVLRFANVLSFLCITVLEIF